MGVQQGRWWPRLALAALGLYWGGLGALWAAGNFSLPGGIDGEYQLSASYAYAIRLEKPHDGVINAPPSAEIPIPDFLKYPESNNYDDGDRNFDQYDAVNNRFSMLGEIILRKNDFGLMVRGDAFYDLVYRDDNANASPHTLNTRQMPSNTFTDEARAFSGKRARLLDAYAFGTFYLPASTLNLRVGKHIAAWGESLFFGGVALAQTPADATKATVPGADVKSILLPVNQVSASLTINHKLTLLAQYKLDFKEVELNPVGEFYSVSDVVGPGAEFIYGIKNPVYPGTLADIDLLSNDLIETLNLVNDLLLGGLLPELPPLLPEALPELSLPDLSALTPFIPEAINVEREADIRPSDHGQWGVGLRYLTDNGSTLGFYRLRYHSTTPAPVQNYGDGILIPSLLGLPPITTALLGLEVPVTYNIRYFDGIDLTAVSLGTTLFGISVGAELIYREGVDVLVDVDGGILGPVPTPTRADVWQGLLSGIYVLGPRWFWDSMALVGEVGYVHVDKVTPTQGPDGRMFDQLSNTRDAWGYSAVVNIDKRNILTGWDGSLLFQFAGIGAGQSALTSGLGSLMGEGDYRLGAGVAMTYANRFSVGLNYSGFLGTPHFEKRPYQDRDVLSLTLKYAF